MAARLLRSGGRGTFYSPHLQRMPGFSSSTGAVRPASSAAEISAAASTLKPGELVNLLVVVCSSLCRFVIFVDSFGLASVDLDMEPFLFFLCFYFVFLRCLCSLIPPIRRAQ